MAELALLASIIQVADVGIRLSLRLYTFGETVASADRSILAISKDVSFTSAVLKELGRVFEDDKGRIHSENATKTAEAVVQECSDVFQEMDGLLLKKVPSLRPGIMDKKARAKVMLERLRWPVIRGKIELLNCNLDRMKSTLTLMLNVIIYAQQVSNRNEPASVITEQRQLIEILAQAKEERDKALEQAKRALEYKPVASSNDTPFLTTMNLMATSVGLGKSEQPRSSNDTPLVPSQARTLHTELDRSNHLNQLLDEYTRLQKNLTDEIHSEQYIIQQDSRKRLKMWVDNAHNDEVRRLTVTNPKDYDANGKSKESGKRQMQLDVLAEIDAEIDDEDSLQVDVPDNLERKPTDRTSNSFSQQSGITAMMPRPPAPEPELREYEDGLLSYLKNRSKSSRPNDARKDVCKKNISHTVSEHRDSSDMNEGKYDHAPPTPHDSYTVADCGEDSGAADLDQEYDMAFVCGDEPASEGRVGIGEKVEKDGREGGEGEDKRREQQAANDLVRLKRARSTLAARKSRANRRKATEFRRDKTSVAERLLAAWTTVEPVM